MPPLIDVRVPRGPQTPALARRLVRDGLSGGVSPTVLADAQVVVSELVSNAVVHGAGSIRLILDVDEAAVRGEVIDEGAGFEVDVRERGLDELGGRGLWLVSSLTRRWGIHDGSSHVWFELARPRVDADPTPPRLGEEGRPEELP
jgi:anti-sigma regulatory factor (Ser/Thr protein kinase)